MVGGDALVPCATSLGGRRGAQREVMAPLGVVSLPGGTEL